MGPVPERPRPPKGVYANHGANHIAVDIGIAGDGVAVDGFGKGFYTAVDAQCQAIAGVINLLYDLGQLVGVVANYMQYGAKYFLGKLLEALQFKYMGGDKAALLALVWQVDFGD